VANTYFKLLSEVKEIVLPKVRPNSVHSFHLFVIRTEKRDELQEFLKENGVETAIHYPIALPNMNAYKYLNHQFSDFPIASNYQSQILSLPIYPELTENQIEYIVNTIKFFFDNNFNK
jgi:dTDP-4-amino-4,6-dideoxygalactose transaminase